MGTFSVIDPVEDWDPDAANSWLVKEAEEALELTRGPQSRKVAQDCNATWTACSIHMLNRNGAGWGGSGRSRPPPITEAFNIGIHSDGWDGAIAAGCRCCFRD